MFRNDKELDKLEKLLVIAQIRNPQPITEKKIKFINRNFFKIDRFFKR